MATKEIELVPNPLHMLTERQKKFVEAYLVDKNGKESAIKAGYSAKHAHIEACRLLNKPRVKAALDHFLGKAIMSRETFVDKALQKFESVPNETVKPRYLEIAGKAMGYLGGSGEGAPSTQTITNNVQVNMKLDIHSLPTPDLLDKIKNLIDL